MQIYPWQRDTYDGWTFRNPPNWPEAPEHWEPTDDWRPHPSWGDAPEGWVFWEYTGRARPYGHLRDNKKMAQLSASYIGPAGRTLPNKHFLPAVAAATILFIFLVFAVLDS